LARTVHERAEVIPLIAEVFRELGYHGASMSSLTLRTGVAKGSLYHFFPGGKEEMASAVLAHVDAWFVREIYEPLERDEAGMAIAGMWSSVDAYFRSGRRVCLIGAFALDDTRDLFAGAIRQYFRRWVTALAKAFARAGADRKGATELSEEIVGGIQGALVLARALGDDKVFGRSLSVLRRRADDWIVNGLARRLPRSK
jgi:TetR/AcrR family transcriptional repressor of lmrAB and yxaGH operons